METPSETHEDAVKRLEIAREDHDRRTDQHEAATGSSKELPALANLQAAEQQFAAREAWVKWTERDY